MAGNVRELENFIERLVVSIEEDNITGNIIESLLNIDSHSVFSFISDMNYSLNELTEKFEKNVIQNYMRKYHNSKELSIALGIDKTTLNRKIKRYGISVNYLK